MTDPAPTHPPILDGVRVLIVEDEYMIAEEVCRELASEGAHILGPVPRTVDALRLVRGTEAVDLALLDVNLGSEAIWPVVDILLSRSVPILLSTGYDASAIPREYASLPRCEKPVASGEVIRKLARLLARPGPR